MSSAVQTKTPTLLLLDGHSLAYRAFYALREVDMSTTTGQPTNAVFGFTSMLINLMRDEEPTHVAVAFDVSRKTFRSETYAGYKAGRSETPDDFRGQVTLIREVLEALRIPTMMVDGFEADDVIATVTTRAVAAGIDVLICTGDRDALQLVNDHVTVLYPKRGVSEMTRFTPEEVQTKYGLSPAQYPDFAALRGDPSDNLPGIPGVGEKTAAKWIREYGSLRELIDRVDTVKGKVGDALREHCGGVELNRRLTELVRDVRRRRRARRRWPASSGTAKRCTGSSTTCSSGCCASGCSPASTPPSPRPTRASTSRSAGSAPTTSRSGSTSTPAPASGVGLAFRGTWGRGTGALTGLALAAADGAAAYVDPQVLSPDDDTALAAWLADPDVPKAVHDVKGPLLALRQHGWPLAGVAERHAAGGLPAAPGPAHLRPRRPRAAHLHRELRSNVEESGQLTLDGGADESDDALAQVETVRATAVARPRRRLRRANSARAGPPSCWPTWSCR